MNDFLAQHKKIERAKYQTTTRCYLRSFFVTCKQTFSFSPEQTRPQCFYLWVFTFLRLLTIVEYYSCNYFIRELAINKDLANANALLDIPEICATNAMRNFIRVSQILRRWLVRVRAMLVAMEFVKRLYFVPYTAIMEKL